MSRKKPRPGVCGTCGRAVVRATPEQVAHCLAGPFADPDDYWVNGHHYVNGRLHEVKCQAHQLKLIERWERAGG